MNRCVRNIKRVLGTVGFLSFFVCLGAVGGMEQDTMPLFRGFMVAVESLGVMWICIRLNEWIDAELERKRELRKMRRQRYIERQAMWEEN